jgi:tetratricopeptide (TPR) repeat protein
MSLLFQFLRDIRLWETSSKIAFGIGVALLIPVVLMLIFGGESLRIPAVISIGGLVTVLQAIALWGNRHLVTPYTKAQRAFLKGDFQFVVELLEDLIQKHARAKKSVNVDVYVLLGNAYRNLGRLDESLNILKQAEKAQPEYHFVMYGLGKTLGALGRYQEAITSIKKSLSQGAPSVVQFDLGFFSYLNGNVDEALTIFRDILPTIHEPHRQLMGYFILNQQHENYVISTDLLEQGLPFWQSEVQRFSNTPYGLQIQDDVKLLQKLIKENT